MVADIITCIDLKGAFVKTKTIQRWIVIAMIAGCLECCYVSLNAQQRRVPEVTIGSTDIGGVVASPSRSEAGVWVIAETIDLPTKFAMVVTDDLGPTLFRSYQVRRITSVRNKEGCSGSGRKTVGG